VFIILNMRSLWRTASPELLRDVGLVGLADGIVGLSFGATSVGGGLPWWVPVALSVLVFAGGSQIAAVGVVLAGGSPVAAVLAGAVLNTRLLPYGFAVADVVGADVGDRDGVTARAADFAGTADAADGSSVRDTADTAGGGRAGGLGWYRGGTLAGRRRRGLRLLAGTHLITDESVAFALRQSDPPLRRSAFWTCGVPLFVIWNLSVLLGVGLGSAVRDTNAFGLDATFPAVMLALALPTLTSRSTKIAAGTGAVIAVALTPVLPAGLPLLAALGGLSTRWGGWRNRNGGRGWRAWRVGKDGRTGADRAADVLSGSRARLPRNGEGGNLTPTIEPGTSLRAPHSVATVADQEELPAGGDR
jgi:branched chain amino acid efflux pump